MTNSDIWRLTGAPSESFSWWSKRSSIREYQKAYDKIAQEIILDNDEILTDIACGKGEVIRRIPTGGKIIGTDSNLHALIKAKKNLKKHNIESKVFPSSLSMQELQRELKEKRVTLIVDNMYKSKLPDNFCHKVVHTFPEYVTYERASDLKRKDYQPRKIGEMACERDREIHRILKPNGIYYSVEYEALPVGDDYAQQEQTLLEKYGLNNLFRISSAKFIRNEVIASDAGISDNMILEGRPIFAGYSMTILKKMCQKLSQ